MWRGPSAILPHGPTGPTPSGPPRLAPGRGWPRPGFPQGTATLAERVKNVQRILEIRLSFGATSGTLQLQPLAQAAAIVPDDAAERRKPGEFHSPRLAIAGFDHSSPDPTQAAGFDEHQDRFGPKKISSAVACLTLGWATSSITSSNWPAQLASFLGGPSQRRHARGSYRPGHDLQQPPRHAQADTLGLGDAGELVLFVACDLDSVLQPLLEILDLSLLPGELPLEFVDAGLDCGSVDSIGDLTGLAVKRLPRLLSVVRHLGDVAVSAAEDDKGAGDPLRDCGHGAPSIDANRG